jgi:hypothetical protein
VKNFCPRNVLRSAEYEQLERQELCEQAGAHHGSLESFNGQRAREV